MSAWDEALNALDPTYLARKREAANARKATATPASGGSGYGGPSSVKVSANEQPNDALNPIYVTGSVAPAPTHTEGDAKPTPNLGFSVFGLTDPDPDAPFDPLMVGPNFKSFAVDVMGRLRLAPTLATSDFLTSGSAAGTILCTPLEMGVNTQFGLYLHGAGGAGTATVSVQGSSDEALGATSWCNLYITKYPVNQNPPLPAVSVVPAFTDYFVGSNPFRYLRVILVSTTGTVNVSCYVTCKPAPFMNEIARAEDSGHTSGDLGTMALGVRSDADAALSGANLDYTPLAVDQAGKLRVRRTPDAARILNGFTATGAAVALTVPANKIWRGSIQISGGDSNAIGAAGTTATPNVVWAPGAGGTTGYTAAQLTLTLPATLISGVIGAWDSGAVSVPDVIVYAGTGAGTFTFNLGGAPSGSVSLCGILEDPT